MTLSSPQPLEIPPGLPLAKGGETQVKNLCHQTVLPPKVLALALARADLVRLYRRAVEAAGRGHGQAAKKDFVRDYNLGTWPQLYAALGAAAWQTLDRWAAALRDTGDPLKLAPKWGENWRVKERSQITGTRRGVTEEQEKILLAQALHPNRKPIKEAVSEARRLMRARGVDPGLSDRTLARVLEDFKERHYDQWVFYRQGEKALNDECVPYLVRDPERLAVGDCLVADGHTFNAEILNPWTGKPQRMTLILFYEMRANYPLGWEIMPTENTQAIAAALRRSILRLGKMPLCVYLDNGRAFGAKHFTANLAESGLAGLFERLGIETIFARPYHAQSKTVERFFGNFAELERRFPSYTGTCIEKKPARLMRNEKLHQRMHTKITGDFVPSIEQAHRAVAGFFDDYVERKSSRSRYLKGRCPREIFEAGAGPGVEEGRLAELMMTMEIRSIRRAEISLPGPDGPILYRHAELYGRKHQTLIRYDLQDRSRILVYETTGEFICEARPATEVHPLARVTGSGADQEELKAELAGQKRLVKSTLAAARAFTEAVIVPEGRALLESRGLAGSSTGFKPVAPGKAKLLPLSAGDVEKIQREFEGLRIAGGDACATDACATGEAGGTVLELPAAVDEVELLCDHLAQMRDPDRYERLLELEAQGYVLPRRELAWQHYFEETEIYARQKDYFEERRAMLMVCYQAG